MRQTERSAMPAGQYEPEEMETAMLLLAEGFTLERLARYPQLWERYAGPMRALIARRRAGRASPLEPVSA